MLPKAQHLKRYKDIAWLLVKHGRSDLVRTAGLDGVLGDDAAQPPEVVRIIAEELGVRISKAFAEFEPTPLAAASLGQVHRAKLRSGRRVAVKVQRPGVREQVLQDLDALASIGTFIDEHTEVGHQYEFARMIDEFRRSVLRELDYIQEGGHLVTFKRNLAGFERLVVPAPVEDYTTSRVLTMEYVPGT